MSAKNIELDGEEENEKSTSVFSLSLASDIYGSAYNM